MRVAFDLDGVLADFAGAYRTIADRLRPGRGPTVLALQPPAVAASEHDRSSARLGRRVWREIRSTENFWQTLDPLEADMVRRLHEESVSSHWETFFVTQRPATTGDTVQLQTQRWLVEQGFALPAVIVHGGPRGKLAAALELDILVDDTIEHCVGAIEESDARPILVCREDDPVAETNAEHVGITVCRTVSAALDVVRREAAANSRRPHRARLAEWAGLKQR